MALTEKQIKVLNSEIAQTLQSNRIALYYSMQLLTGYRDDLREEAKEVTKEIASANKKLKAIEGKMVAGGIRLHKMKG